MNTRYTLYIDLATLHRLVWCMSQREQVTYGALAQQMSAYDKLYGILREKQEFDEDYIHARAVEKGIYKSAQVFTKLRHYLYHVLLKSLLSASDAEQSDIQSLIMQARIMIFKGFHEQVPAILKAASSLATSVEDFNHCCPGNLRNEK